jgi:hypothetical protein
MAATPFFVPHVRASDLSAAFSLRYASAEPGSLPASKIAANCALPITTIGALQFKEKMKIN